MDSAPTPKWRHNGAGKRGFLPMRNSPQTTGKRSGRECRKRNRLLLPVIDSDCSCVRGASFNIRSRPLLCFSRWRRRIEPFTPAFPNGLFTSRRGSELLPWDGRFTADTSQASDGKCRPADEELRTASGRAGTTTWREQSIAHSGVRHALLPPRQMEALLHVARSSSSSHEADDDKLPNWIRASSAPPDALTRSVRNTEKVMKKYLVALQFSDNPLRHADPPKPDRHPLRKH